VIDVVQSELKKARHTGWVLNGFPRTRVQAQTLANKEMGFCLDKILLLNTGEKAIREQYAKKMQTTSLGSSEKEEMINTRLQQYQRHVISIVELFKNVVRQIEVGAGDDDQGLLTTSSRTICMCGRTLMHHIGLHASASSVLVHREGPRNASSSLSNMV